ncbi:uncharacterized protein EV422DRAFT_602965 [Fimicolochytrium jonesii]|uniref:uncharacterized protein n=1 Tax=Fimicolochytrium jonesii TaxID=1396493 RepID=UPI0022FDCC55|nr:uncharacterized protein EV422DRAFT_602965 [Fimicolochytrium jonesii]KAI8818215.1 hypothetical protein EV422DRAFT_602965 [Fimicolochytrium jonesii]
MVKRLRSRSFCAERAKYTECTRALSAACTALVLRKSKYDVTHSRSKQFGGQNRGEGKAVYHPHEKDPPNLYARLQAEISSSDASSFAADTFSSVVGNNLPAVESDDIAMDDDARMESASDNDSDVDITGNSTPLHRMSDVGNDVDAAGDTDEEALTKEKENAFDVFGGRPKYSEVSAAPARHEYEKAADCKLPSKSCAPKKRKVSEAKSAKRPKQPRKASVSTEKAMPDDFKPEMLYATDDLQMWARKRKRIDYAAMSKGIGRAEKARDVGIDGNGRKSDSRGRSSRASPDGLATPLNGRAGVAQPRSTKSTMPTCACGEPTTGVGARENEFCIGCEGCDVWFHGRCVGVPDAPTADAYAKWVCSACFAKGERSSWKLMCRADGCDGWAEVEVEDPLADVPNGAGDDAPLPLASKFENLPRRYCSSTCGRRAAKAIRNTIQIPTRPRPPPTEETINANMFARLSTWQAVQAAEVIDRAKLDKLQSEKASVKRWVHALELRRRRIREAIAACLALNGVSEEDMHKGDDGQVDHEGGGQAGTYNITVAPEDRICGFDARIVAEWVVDEPDHGDEGCDEEWSKVKTDDSWKEKPSMVNGHDGEAPLDEVRVSEVQGQDHRAVAPDRARDIDTPESAKSRPFRAEIVQHSNGDASDAMLIDTSAESSIRSGADKEKSQDGDAHEGDAIAIHRPSPSVANGVISTKCVAAQPVECDDGSRSVTGDLPAHQTPASEREREGDGMAVDGTALAEEAGKMNLPSHVVSADAHQPISGHDVALGNGDATLQPSSDSLQIVARSSAEDKVVHAQTSPSETDPMDIVAPDKPLVEGTSHDGPDKNGSEAIPSADKQHEALVSGPSHPPSLSHHPSDMPTSPADPSPQHDQPPPPLCTHTGKCPLHEDWERLKWREVELELQTALARLDGLRKTGTPAVWRSLRRRREV